MTRECPGFAALQAAAAGGADAAPLQDHLLHCTSCREIVHALRDLSPMLMELAQTDVREAERSGAAAGLWPHIAARRERPHLTERLPLPAAAALRVLGEVLRPAAAITAAAGITGVLLGAWLAVSWRSPVDANESDPYVASSLMDERGGGLASTYDLSLESDADVSTPEALEPATPTTEPGSPEQPAPAGESADSVPGGRS